MYGGSGSLVAMAHRKTLHQLTVMVQIKIKVSSVKSCLCIYMHQFLIIPGNITISDGVTFTVDSDLNGASPQFTLTCISTGGPATTVTWTRDSDTITEGTETVLDDRVTAQYTHTLTVIGRLEGLYTCTVANDKPSEAQSNITIQGMYVAVLV